MIRIVAVSGVALLLAGCAGGGSPGRPAPHVAVPRTPAGTPANLAAVMGADGESLVARFGPPRLDQPEGSARKYQFANETCVLDAYLYPQRDGQWRVTHIDARQRDGTPIDQASCVAALTRR